ncbi:MAG: hypothetical protein Q9218_000300 [Villophora microphyllina]
MSTKRSTTIPSTSTIHPLAIPTGTYPLTIGENTYIQVRAHLNTTHAPITIGQGCVISEYTQIGIQQKDNPGNENGGDRVSELLEGVVIEDHVVIEAKAVIEGRRIGEGTIIECGVKIGRGAVVGKYCKISPLCSVAPIEVIPDYTVIYGFNERRIDRSGTEALRVRTAEAHVEVLKKAEMATRAAQSAKRAGG